MKKLSKAQVKQRDDLEDKLDEAHQKLSDEIENFNSKMEALLTEVTDALAKYDEALEEANAFREMVCEEMQSYADERSEKWQEGEAGEAYGSWIDQWDTELEELDVVLPENIEVPERDATFTSDNYADSPEEV